ncbi:MAG: cobyrinic acid a,c-diamide synthase, partial [Gammaproteobacteria bacterium]
SEIDVTQTLELAPRLSSVVAPASTQVPSRGTPVRIGIAKDRAFSFYYPQDLEAMERAGAELLFFDTLHDATIPRVDALMLGGGFPEAHVEALSANRSMRQSIVGAAVNGMPIYGECGGLMYLARSVSAAAGTFDMCGVLPIDVRMEVKPVGRGYVRLSENGNAPWGRIALDSGATLAAHEFHYSRATDVADDVEYAYTVERGFGVDGSQDGLVVGNVFASYAHLRHTERTPWVNNFLSWVRSQHHHINPQEFVRHGT